MSDITPENLKKVAEYMGLKPYILFGNLCYDVETEWSTETIEYNPLQNSDQCLELIEKLKICVMPAEENIFWDAYLGHDGKIYEAVGKSINEAVTLAAIAYVEGL